MKTQRLTNSWIAMAILFILFGTSCKKSYDSSNPYQTSTGNPPASTAVTGIQITSNSKFGNILTDNNGKSLYFFAKDVSGASTCVDGCMITWPVFYKADPSIGTGLTASDFGVITRPDGSKQNTYKGWPLYYYMNDAKAGDANGDGVGSTWAIAKPDYTIMFGNAQLVGNDNLQYTDQGVAGVASSQYFTDANGRTLYQFSKDAPNQNNFSNNDATHDAIWPIYVAGTTINIPSIFDKTLFSTITVFGKTQLVFKGHPLYTFSMDNGTRGNTKGVSFPTAGAAIWKVVNANTPASVATLTGVQLSDNAKFGKILTDNLGRSLYFFSKDASGNTACVDGCAITWPVFYKENPSIGTGLAAADFGVITRPDGSKQTTYKGWPLYYYTNDAKAGDANGDAVGNLWAIAKADYTVMFGNAQLVGLDGVQYNDQGLPGTGLSQYITDPNGRSLYQFSKDASKQNNFTKSDFSNDSVWPIYTVSAVGSIPTVLDKTQFSTINVFGKTQLVFKGHPMYFFGQDNASRGNTKGVSVPTPGAAVWKVQNSAEPIL